MYLGSAFISRTFKGPMVLVWPMECATSNSSSDTHQQVKKMLFQLHATDPQLSNSGLGWLLPHQTLNFLDLNKQAPYTPTFNDSPLQAQDTQTYMVISSRLCHAFKAITLHRSLLLTRSLRWLYRRGKIGTFHTKASLQYLLSKKVFHISQYLVHLHHLTHQLPIKITCKETAMKKSAQHSSSFVMVISDEEPWRVDTTVIQAL